jgi:hypothetical protein
MIGWILWRRAIVEKCGPRPSPKGFGSDRRRRVGDVKTDGDQMKGPWGVGQVQGDEMLKHSRQGALIATAIVPEIVPMSAYAAES